MQECRDDQRTAFRWKCCGNSLGSTALSNGGHEAARTDPPSVAPDAVRWSTHAGRVIVNDPDRYGALHVKCTSASSEGVDQADFHPDLVVGPMGRVGKVYEDPSTNMLHVTASCEWAAILDPEQAAKAHYFWNARSNATQWSIPADLVHQAGAHEFQ